MSKLSFVHRLNVKGSLEMMGGTTFLICSGLFHRMSTSLKALIIYKNPHSLLVLFFFYIADAEIELTEEIREMGYPLEHPHKLCCLRQELVDSFVESRYMTFIKVAAYHLQKFGFKAQQAAAEKKSEKPIIPIEASENDTCENTDGKPSVDQEGEDSSNTVEFVENITKSPEKGEGNFVLKN